MRPRAWPRLAVARARGADRRGRVLGAAGARAHAVRQGRVPARGFLPRRARRARGPLGAGVVRGLRRRPLEPERHARAIAPRLGRARALRRRHARSCAPRRSSGSAAPVHEQLRAGARRPGVPRRADRRSAPASRSLALRTLVARRAPSGRASTARRAALRPQRRGRGHRASRSSPSPGRGWSCPPQLDGKAYYEVLFWGGGHVLQFTWTLLMFVAWLWLAERDRARAAALAARRAAALRDRARLGVRHAGDLSRLRRDLGRAPPLQTWLMRFGGGLAIVPFRLALLWAIAPRRAGARRAARPLRAALAASLVLFAAGGLIGLAISGSNVKIPAHYHGSIVGVTLAFMGLAYHLLPQLGFAAPPHAARHAAALALRRRAARAHRRAGVVGRLRRAAQGGGRRAGAAHAAGGRGHGAHGPGRPGRRRRGAAFVVVVIGALRGRTAAGTA